MPPRTNLEGSSLSYLPRAELLLCGCGCMVVLHVVVDMLVLYDQDLNIEYWPCPPVTRGPGMEEVEACIMEPCGAARDCQPLKAWKELRDVGARLLGLESRSRTFDDLHP